MVNGGPGAVVVRGGRVLAVAAFTIAGGRITGVSIVADPDKLRGVSV